MNNLLDAIKKYPVIFIDTLKWRAGTSPSKFNSKNHLLLAKYIEEQKWLEVKQLISNLQYYNALEGVLICLNIYDYDENFTLADHNKIIEFLKSGNLF